MAEVGEVQPGQCSLWVVEDGLKGPGFPLKEMSDGYRTVATLVLDIVRQIHGVYGRLDTASTAGGGTAITQPGVVLIDEVDAHLHVTWQRKIGGWLQEHFLNIQFIVSNHSPYICQAADEGGLIRLPGVDEQQAPEVVAEDLYRRGVHGSGDNAVRSGAGKLVDELSGEQGGRGAGPAGAGTVIPLQRVAVSSHAQSLLTRWTKRVEAAGSTVEAAREQWGEAKAAKKHVRAALETMTHGAVRCMYCDDSRATDINHFQPLAKAPLRALVWANHLLACSHCNSNVKRHSRFLQQINQHPPHSGRSRPRCALRKLAGRSQGWAVAHKPH
jgi:hypothetical protein